MDYFDTSGICIKKYSACALLFQDANVKLIRELKEEIDRLKAMLMSVELVCTNI